MFVTGQPSSNPAIRVSDAVDTLRFMFGVGIECSCPKIEGGIRSMNSSPPGITRTGRPISNLSGN